MKTFKITNNPHSVDFWVTLASVIGCLFAGLAVVDLILKATEAGIYLSPVFILLGLGLSYMIADFKKTDVTYEEGHVRLASRFKKTDIDLSKVKEVTFSFEKGYGRGAYDCIKVEFIFDHVSEDETDSISIYDRVSEETVNSLMKGEHAGFSLAELYDAIIADHPDKKKEIYQSSAT